MLSLRNSWFSWIWNRRVVSVGCGLKISFGLFELSFSICSMMIVCWFFIISFGISDLFEIIEMNRHLCKEKQLEARYGLYSVVNVKLFISLPILSHTHPLTILNLLCFINSSLSGSIYWYIFFYNYLFICLSVACNLYFCLFFPQVINLLFRLLNMLWQFFVVFVNLLTDV